MRSCLGLVSVFGVTLLLACSDESTPATTQPPGDTNPPTTSPGTAGGGGGGGEKPKGTETPDTNTPEAPVTCSGAPGTFYALSAKRLGHEEEKLCRYEGTVVLVVNGASACGYTPQYKPLQAMYAKYTETQGKKFVVLAFPSDSFNQEKDTDKQVSEFCTDEYGITFPLFSIGPVIDDATKKETAQPVYKWLASQPGMSSPVAWNFEKFLIGKDGKVVKRWASATSPEAGGEIDLAVAAELAK